MALRSATRCTQQRLAQVRGRGSYKCIFDVERGLQRAAYDGLEHAHAFRGLGVLSRLQISVVLFDCALSLQH